MIKQIYSRKPVRNNSKFSLESNGAANQFNHNFQLEKQQKLNYFSPVYNTNFLAIQHMLVLFYIKVCNL